jgi:hypothetical protein
VIEKNNLHAAPSQLIHQHHLIGIVAREPVGRQNVQPVDCAGVGHVAQSLQRRSHQRAAAVALIDETHLALDGQTINSDALLDSNESVNRSWHPAPAAAKKRARTAPRAPIRCIEWNHFAAWFTLPPRDAALT